MFWYKLGFPFVHSINIYRAPPIYIPDPVLEDIYQDKNDLVPTHSLKAKTILIQQWILDLLVSLKDKMGRSISKG